MEALKKALTGVNSQREEAFVLLAIVPEEYLHDIVENLPILNGINKPIRNHIN
jgi:hypothetical protein